MNLREHLLEGLVIPAHPLALTEQRTLDETCQRALTRYYVAAGAGGVAVGVHTTQFAIREPQHNLLRPVLELASETGNSSLTALPRPFVKIAGICGRTPQAVAEAELARSLGYDVGLLSPGAWRDASDAEILTHCQTVAETMPLFGFYLQPAVGGRVLRYRFWRQFAEIENVVAIKIAPFNRYQTLDVVRAVVESGRKDIALYTGNDDNILPDLLTPYAFDVGGKREERSIVGGLLGQWAVGTQAAVQMLTTLKQERENGTLQTEWLRQGIALTDMNAALFDVAHNFAGCIAGIHSVLQRQGLLRGIWCLEPTETLSPGQQEEIERVRCAYPHLLDDPFIAEHRDGWLR